MTEINKIANGLSDLHSNDNIAYPFEIQPIPGEVDILKITIEDMEELPVYVSVSDNQILCISYLFKEDEICNNDGSSLHDIMLKMNIPMPLSSFSKINDQYVIFGALSINSSINDIAHEIEILSENTLEAIETLKDYLK